MTFCEYIYVVICEINLVIVIMSTEADIETLIQVYQDLQDLIKHNLEVDDIVKKGKINFDRLEIASETIIEICERLEVTLQPQKSHAIHRCCCAEA